jgi:hypothetical protein
MIRAQCVMSLQNHVGLANEWMPMTNPRRCLPVSHDGEPLVQWSQGLLELLAHGLRIAQQHLRVGLVEDCEARTSTALVFKMLQTTASPTTL